MMEGKSGASVPPDGGDSVWLVGDRITVKLTSEDTGGVYSVAEELYSESATLTFPCWRVMSSSCSARTPYRRARARASTPRGAPCTPSRTWERCPAGY